GLEDRPSRTVSPICRTDMQNIFQCPARPMTVNARGTFQLDPMRYDTCPESVFKAQELQNVREQKFSPVCHSTRHPRGRPRRNHEPRAIFQWKVVAGLRQRRRQLALFRIATDQQVERERTPGGMDLRIRRHELRAYCDARCDLWPRT